MVAVGQRDAGIGGAGHGGGDAGYHFEGNVVPAQEFQFLATAPEHERVAAFQPHHALAGACVLQHQRMDVVLAHAVAAGRLAYFNARCVAP